MIASVVAAAFLAGFSDRLGILPDPTGAEDCSKVRLPSADIWRPKAQKRG